MTITENMGSLFDRKLPTALIVGLVLQSAGALFWAGSAAERLTTLEKSSLTTQTAMEDVAVLKEQILSMKQALDRIERKLDRAS